MQTLVFPFFVVAGVWLPGWLAGRWLRLPISLGGAVLGSAALLVNTVLVIDGLGLPLTLLNVGGALGLFSTLCAWLSSRRPKAQPLGPWSGRLAPDAFWWAAGVGLLAIAIRAVVDPLSGFDTDFRWDFLARQMMRTASLAYYPAVTTENFLNYAWCDGIPPLVSSLYFWSYLSLGHVARWATTPVVLLVAFLLFRAIGELAGQGAKSRAGAVAAGSALLLWGVAMGQETGLTALSLCLMFVCLDRHRLTGETGWLIWAGVAAGTGALAREYGLAYPALGALALFWHRAGARALRPFLAAAIAVAGPWYLRNWLKTGNPLWPHELGGLLPGNPVQAEYYRGIVEVQAQLASLGINTTGLPALAVLAAVPLGLGLVGGLAQWRLQAPRLFAIAAIAALWYWSIAKTSGGPHYALRVLTPAVALAAAMGGGAVSLFAGSRARWLAAGLLGALALDAGIRSLYLPQNPPVRWWREPVLAWRELSRYIALNREDPQWAEIARAADGKLILSSDPSHHAILTHLGAPTLPLYAPGVGFLFEPAADFPACLARLRQEGFRFVILSRDDVVVNRMLAPYPFFQALSATSPSLTRSTYFVHDLYPTRAKAPP
ncbi:MAG: hypothetical protein ABIQ12_11600 [Opitutaceae bacterium]